MKYEDYIKEHQSEIKPKETSISNIYSKKPEWLSWINNIPNSDLKSFINELEIQGFNKKITRQDVFDMFDKDLYKGFIYSMLWGGIGIIDKSNLVNAFSTSKEEIVRKLGNVKRMVNGNNLDLENAFGSMLNANRRDNNKINGVGISYLTKLLFFLCEDNNPKKETDTNNKVLPLIYDKWGKNMHIALLIDSLDNNKMRENKYLSINDYYGNVETNTDYNIYYNYLLKLKEVANKFNKKPGEIEEFLFGYSKDKEKEFTLYPNTNPRVFAELYIQKYCDYLFGSKSEWSGITKDELNNYSIRRNKSKTETKTSNRGDPEDKKKNSKTKVNNKQNHREEPTLTRDFTHDINDLKKRYPHLNVFDNSKKISGRKVYWGCDLSENLSLYVGRTYDKRTFCSIYRKEGIPQTIIEQLNDLLPKSYKDWIGKYCNYEEAVQTLYQVIDRLKITKG